MSAVLHHGLAAVVAWSAQAVSEGDAGSPATVTAAVKESGSRRHFHAAHRLGSIPALGTGRYVSERPVKVVQTRDRRVFAAWSSFAGGHYVVQAAQLESWRVGVPQTLSNPAVDSVLTDLDAGPRGEIAVQWRTGVAGTGPGAGTPGLQASFRRPHDPVFQTAETIQSGKPAYSPTLRFDPATGRALAAWNSIEDQQLLTSVRPPV
jgi:hypothetical protein